MTERPPGVTISIIPSKAKESIKQSDDYSVTPSGPSVIPSEAKESHLAGKMTKLMLCGCTEGDAADLLPLAKSWLRAPRMTLAGQDVPYDVTQRAYVCEIPSPAEQVRNDNTLRLEASAEHPVRGLCLIMKGVSSIGEVKVDGKAVDGVKAGVHRAWDGESLILWLPVEADSPVDISF